MKRSCLFLVVFYLGLSTCLLSQPPAPQLVDKQASRRSRILYQNLHLLSQQAILFGQHESMAYGVGWKKEKGRSDVKALTGSYPAVHGWDIGRIGTDNSINGVPFADVLGYIKDVYRRGGINTVAWHMDHPVTGKNSWDTTAVVKDLLPGGPAHAVYVQKLDLAAAFFKKCQAGIFTPIPLIFRPFHEHNGSWFWWGKQLTEEEDFIRLWRFTYQYLHEEKKVHNLIWAFSPDRSRMDLSRGQEGYLWGYPGDAYVDIIGLDDYWDMGFSGNPKPLEEQQQDLISSLRLIEQIALEKGKLAALTETGLDKLPQADWYTAHLLPALKEGERPLQLAYFMLWRNANPNHHYVPYRGHPAAQDFQQFCRDPLIVLEGELLRLYKRYSPARMKRKIAASKKNSSAPKKVSPSDMRELPPQPKNNQPEKPSRQHPP